MVLFGLAFLPVFAQDGELDPDLQSYFLTLAAMVPLVTLVMGWVKKILKVTGTVAQLVSWAVSIALCYVGWVLKLGMFADVVLWYVPLVWGAAIGLAANGFFKIEFIQMVLRLFKLEPKKDVP